MVLPFCWCKRAMKDGMASIMHIPGIERKASTEILQMNFIVSFFKNTSNVNILKVKVNFFHRSVLIAAPYSIQHWTVPQLLSD